MQNCEYCKKDFLASKINKKCCSTKCWHKLNYSKQKDKIKLAAKKWYENNAKKKKAYQKKKYNEGIKHE